MRYFGASQVFAVALAVMPAAAFAHEHDEHAHGTSENFGTVHFATSCAPEVRPDFERAAAMLHSSTDKHPVTPGSIPPAREQLADLLVELNQPAAALAEYEASLRSAPGRFNSYDSEREDPSMAQPMTKVIAVYRQPKDANSFDKYYAETHTPLVKKMQGLRRLEVTRIAGTADVYQVAELYFDDPGARETALASLEGKAVVDDLPNFAAGIVSVYFGDGKEA